MGQQYPGSSNRLRSSDPFPTTLAPPLPTAPQGLLSASYSERRTGQTDSPKPSGRPLHRGGQQPSEPESAARARHQHGHRVSDHAIPTREPDPRAGGSEAQRGLPRAGPEPPGGEREQPARRLPASFPSPEPPSTHGFSLGGGPGARWRRAGRRGGGAARRCGGPGQPPGSRARRRCPRRSATGTNNDLIITHSDHLCGVLRHKGTAALPEKKKKSFEIYEALYKHQPGLAQDATMRTMTLPASVGHLHPSAADRTRLVYWWTVYLLVLKKDSSVPASLSLCSYNRRSLESSFSLPLHLLRCKDNLRMIEEGYLNQLQKPPCCPVWTDLTSPIPSEGNRSSYPHS
ncbi:uncharacterized protein [Ovis canadensis]|uniref:uncharacterized protein n=1 Tax=Ovis canadensis TaxID=37174 RepID=UPI0037526BCD